MSDHPPRPGDRCPWGTAVHAMTLAPGIRSVSTDTGTGIWLAPQRQDSLPDAIQPRHGRAWLDEAGETALAGVFFEDMPERDIYLATALRTLLETHPHWLDATAPRTGFPDTCQAGRIDRLWAAHRLPGRADLSAFRHEEGAEPGSVSGQLGERRVTIAPGQRPDDPPPR